MSRYLYFVTAAALLPAAAQAQQSTESALEEIIAAQDAAAEPAVADRPAAEAVPDRPAAPSITVTANGLGTDLRNTGQAVTLIDRAEIEAVQGADPARVLRRTPGLSIGRNGGMGSFTGVSIRGANAEQVLVLVDGVRVADPASPAGGFDFGNLLLGTVGKLDILRGSNSTIWGSDAIGGVIDITTRGESGVVGSVEYGSRDTLYASAAGGLAEDSYFLGLTGSWYRTDGISSAASGTEADGFEQVALGSSAFVDLTDRLEAFAHANWSEGDLDLDGYAPPAFLFDDTLDTQRTRRAWGDAGLAFYGNDLTLRAAYSLADTERDNFDADGIETFASDGHSERLSLRGEYRAIGPVTVAFGADQEWLDYATSFDPAAQADIFGAYVQLGFVMGRVAAHIGSRVDDHSLFGGDASYGADVSYGLGEDWRLRASLGEGFKAPTLFQLFSDYGNRRLVPEESTSFDIGLEKGQRGRGAHFALTAFNRDSDDLIGFLSCFGSTAEVCDGRPFGTYDNVARARAHGIEIEGGFDVASGLRLSGVYAFVDAEDRTTGFDLARRPHHMATLFADWNAASGLSLGADLRLVGPSFDDAAQSVALKGYELVDLRAALPLSEGVELTGRIENLFDADYRTTAGYGSPGRSAYVGVRARM